MAIADTARLIASLELDPGKFTGGVDKALGRLGKLESGIGRIGRGGGQLAAGLGRASAVIGAVAVGAVGAATKAAIDWEDAFTGVRKTVDATATTSLEDLDRGLRDMATTMPVTAADLALIAENAGAMGLKADDILQFTDVVAKLGATTDVSVDQASMSLGQLQNVIGLTSDEFDNFGNTLVDLGNKGNSTESQILEIARRSGGAAKLFGIAKEQTLGWAAAAANLGMNQELAGTALQKVFLSALPKFVSGNKQLQKVTGLTAKQLKKAYEEDAGGALEFLFQKLRDLPKEARLDAVQDIFGKTSGTTRLVLGLADSFDKNLVPALDQSTKAWQENAAMQEEFEKRNATVKSAMIRLKNTATDIAITFGEGVAPSIGRAADKLAAFLKQGDNRAQIKTLGEDLGKAIDGIKWNEVLDGAKEFAGLLKDALGMAKGVFDVINTLPNEVKAAGLGLIGLNKISGGLIASGIGNIVGGLAGALGGALIKAGIGRAFVQPVFVTNMGAGMGAGGAGAAGGGLLGLVAGIAGPLLILDGLSRLPDAFDSALDALKGESGAAQRFIDTAQPWLEGSLFAPFLGKFQELIDEIDPPKAAPEDRSRDQIERTKADIGNELQLNPNRTLRIYGEVEDKRGAVKWDRIGASVDQVSRISADQRRAIDANREAILGSKFAMLSKLGTEGRADRETTRNSVDRLARRPVHVKTTNVVKVSVSGVGVNNYVTASYINKMNQAPLD